MRTELAFFTIAYGRAGCSLCKVFINENGFNSIKIMPLLIKKLHAHGMGLVWREKSVREHVMDRLLVR